MILIWDWRPDTTNFANFIYNKKRVTARERFITENIVLQRFKENSGIKEEWEKAESKIYIVCNGNIFNFSVMPKGVE